MNNNYKSVSKYLSKQQSNNKLSISLIIKKALSKIMLSLLLLIVGLIVLKYDSNNSKSIYKFIYENNFSFATINEYLKNHFGDIIPFQGILDDETTKVFNEDLVYSNLSIYKDGISLDVTENYLVPSLNDGIVIFVGEKENFGNTIIIQTEEGVNIWFGNIVSPNVNIYDYVKESSIIGMVDGTKLYLAFEKEGTFVDYKTYF